MTELRKRPVVLIIRDGWGHNPDAQWNHANAVHLAKTPVDDRLRAGYPHTLIRTSGPSVGLPDGVMGNSEVGHQNIGAGRVVEQELMRITGRIHDGSFFTNETLAGAFVHARRTGGVVHIMGLCSDGQVHSDLDHLDALLQMPDRLDFPPHRVRVHAITDGRDTAPSEGRKFVAHVEQQCSRAGIPPVASVIGRYYAMDRDDRWDRTEKAYRLLTRGEGDCFDSAIAGVESYYDYPTEVNRRGDEFITPSVVATHDHPFRPISNGDSVIFFNFRGDRPRQLVKAFTFDEFPFVGKDKNGNLERMGFDRETKLDLYFATMTAYEEGLPVQVAFKKPARMANILGAYLSRLGLRQYRTAETEKFAHVTYFFNDYRDAPFDGEDRFLVPSPRDISTYDQRPEMSAPEVTDEMVKRVRSGKYDAMVINYANGDMVGHTGNLSAAIAAVEAVDTCVGRVVDAVLAVGGALIVTADHGNCELMIDPETGGPHTAHTVYDVAAIVVDDDLGNAALHEGGKLADLAPTMLALMGLEQPPEMNGRSLVVR